MDNTKIVGEKIKALRESKQISVADLVERTGLAQQQIERIENNIDIPSLAPLIKIARALGFCGLVSRQTILLCVWRKCTSSRWRSSMQHFRKRSRKRRE